jgi:TonB-linked SusC/RagA family outer membrane protein
MLKDVTSNQRANVSLSGGGPLARYYVAANISHDNGNIKVDKRNNYNNNISLIKYAFRSNINLNLTKSTELYLKLSASFDDYNGPIDGGTEVYRMAMQANPVLFQPYYEADEQYSNVRHILYGNYGDGNYVNPYAQVQRGYREYSKNTMLAQLGFKQKLDMVTEGLSVRAFVNIDRYAEFSAKREWTPFYYGISSYKLLDGSYTLKRLKGGSDGLNYSSGDRYINTAFYLEAALEYSRQFNEKHNVNGLFVYTMRESKQSNPHITNLQLSLPNRNIGFAGRMAYNYDYRYMVELNFGYNGSERFAKNNRWGFFPSVGAGWMLSNEKFFEPLRGVFDQFKIKATYGMAGNDQIGDNKDRFYYMSDVNNGADNTVNWGERLDYNPGGGFYVNRYANDQIGWEKSYKLNAGIEFATTFGLGGNVEYFREKRDNILLGRTIPSTTGITQEVKANLGEARGSGVDMEINYEKIFNKDLWIQARGTFTYAASEVLVWEEPDYTDTPWVSAVGQSIGRIGGYIAERLFIDEDEVKNSPVQFGNYTAGDIKYRDVNNDGKINELDKVTIGFPNTPQINYGFGVSAGYKGVDVSCFFQGSARQSFLLNIPEITPFHNIRGDGLIGANVVLQDIANSYWSETNPNPYAFWPRLQNGVNENNNQPSTWWLQDASFLRLKSVEIGYTLPQKVLKKLGMSNLRLYVSGTNLLCWSKFKLWDPELAGSGLNYPLQRVFNVGLNLGF